jgi:DNA mismatch repair protein PMS2
MLKDINPLIGHNIRPSKISSIFASRACRKSIMVGKTLSEPVMKRVVTNLSQLNQPWNCPVCNTSPYSY